MSTKKNKSLKNEVKEVEEKATIVVAEKATTGEVKKNKSSKNKAKKAKALVAKPTIEMVAGIDPVEAVVENNPEILQVPGNTDEVVITIEKVQVETKPSLRERFFSFIKGKRK